MAKKVVGYVKLMVPGGNATPAPPVGPALGQRGINIMEFCKAFNAKTQDKKGLNLPVVITVYQDRSFTFEIKQPTAADLIKRELNIQKGSAKPNKEKVGKITISQLRKLVEQKMPDLNTDDIEAGVRMFIGTARNMGVDVVEG